MRPSSATQRNAAHLKVLSLGSHETKPQTPWRLVRVFSLPFIALPCRAVCCNQSILGVMTRRWIIDSCRRLTGYVIVSPLKHQTGLCSDTVLQTYTEILQKVLGYLFSVYLNEQNLSPYNGYNAYMINIDFFSFQKINLQHYTILFANKWIFFL